MSRYRSYGRLDDQYRSEGDTAFTKMNSRVRPTQLQPGEVQLSQNGRMEVDGTWQPRKGLLTLSGAITIDADAIRLPFPISAAQRQSNVVTLTLVDTPNTAFVPGQTIFIEGLTGYSTNPNGAQTLTSVSFANKQLTFAQTASNESFSTSATSLAFPAGSAITRLGYVITGASVNGNSNVATLTSATAFDSAFGVGDSITVGGLGFSTTDPNGVKTIASVSGTTLTYSLTASGNETYTTSANSLVDLGSLFILNDDGANEVFGSGVFSDPNSDSADDIIFTATNNVCDILRLRDRAKFKVRYPGSNTISGRCDLLQAFNKVYIFRGKQTTLESTPIITSKAITSATRSGNTITVNCTDHGRSVNDFVTLIGLGNFTTDPNGVYKVATAPTVNQFTVTSTASGTETFNASGAVAEYFNDFTLVPSGAYTIPSYIIDTAVEATDGQVTVTEANHGLALGEDLEIIKASSPIDLFAKQSVKVSEVPSVSIFSFNLDVENISLGQNVNLVLSKPRAISYFIHQPATPFAVLNQRRLWMPYFNTSDSSPVKRPNQDEIVASDILNGDTFDVLGGSFKITGGSSDFIVGLEPFTENKLLCFCRRSIHQLDGVSGSLADVQVNVVTPDLGCSARRSIVQIANKIFFLSDQGVYGLEFLDLYNLRGLEVALSEAITPIMKRINQDYVDKAVGAYFDNRYWLAIPIDGAVENNVILIWNTINGGWESIDRVNNVSFNVRDMIVAREGTKNSLYITTSEGGVHQIDGFDGGDQISVESGVSVPQTLDVQSILTTREYDGDTLDRKFFARSEVHVKSDTDSVSDASISFTSSDPDQTSAATTISGVFGANLAQGEDASIRTSVRLRGYGCSATITPTAGRPLVRAVKLDARITDRSRTSTQ